MLNVGKMARFSVSLLLILLLSASISAPLSAAPAPLPGINISFGEGDLENPADMGQTIQILVLLTVLSLAPSILILMTSFTRMIIVLGFTRNALGTQNMPPNQVITGLALILTFFIMSPVIGTVFEEAWTPYSEGEIAFEEAIQRAEAPFREFMLLQTRPEDINLFVNLSGGEASLEGELPFRLILPAYIISELKTAFWMGFMIYVPFLVIDMVVASTLMSMGMMMLPPVMISLPFKVLLFTIVNGWHMVVDAILQSFVVR